MKKIMIFWILAIMMVSLVSGYTITRNSPPAYSVQNQTTVVFNYTPVKYNGPGTELNCSLYLRNRTDAFSVNATNANVNNTDSTFSVLFTDLERGWWKIGCYDRMGLYNQSNETITIPASTSYIGFAQDEYGVCNGTNPGFPITAWVNWTMPIYNESRIMPANGSSPGIELNLYNNGTISSVVRAIANNTVVVTNETVTNVSVMNGNVTPLTYDGYVNNIIIAFADDTIGNNTMMNVTTDYYLADGIVYMNTTKYNGNQTQWWYNYYVLTDMVEGTDYVVSAGMVNATFANTYVGNQTLWTYQFYNGSEITLVEGVDFNVTKDVNSSTLTVNESVTSWSGSGNVTTLIHDNDVTSITEVVANNSYGGNWTVMTVVTDYYLGTDLRLYSNSSSFDGNVTKVTYTYQTLFDNLSRVNMIGNTYLGDTSYWNYSYPCEEHLNEDNTTVRILDVDSLYDDYIPVFAPIKLAGQSGAIDSCDSDHAGVMTYKTSNNSLYVCNSTDWTLVAGVGP